MVKMTPEEYAEKHNRRLKAALEDVRAGVEKVTESPGKLAAQKEAKMKARLVEAIDKGIWKSRVSAVTLEEWKSKMTEVGIPRISGGIDAARDKVRDFASQLLPHISSAQEKIKGLPDLTLEDSINRMTTFIREMAKFKKK
jgi:ElaB/YqjD/DUF883 family membrane-anchored ribosome-binding protein